MINDPIVYPTRKDIELWIAFLKDTDHSIKKFLPITNRYWFDNILATIERVNNPYIVGVSCKAAHLFYYIIKDHHFPDGNKRSGIATAYLFFLLNGYQIRSGERLRLLAKKVARSHGSKQKDQWINKIEKEFSYLCTRLT